MGSLTLDLAFSWKLRGAGSKKTLCTLSLMVQATCRREEEERSCWFWSVYMFTLLMLGYPLTVVKWFLKWCKMLLWERLMRTMLALLRLPSLCGRAALLQKVVLQDVGSDYLLQDLVAACCCNHQYKVQPEASQWCTPGLLRYLHWGRYYLISSSKNWTKGHSTYREDTKLGGWYRRWVCYLSEGPGQPKGMRTQECHESQQREAPSPVPREECPMHQHSVGRLPGKQLCKEGHEHLSFYHFFSEEKQVDHEPAMWKKKKKKPIVHWVALGKALPSSWGRWSFFAQHCWDTCGVLGPVIVSEVQEREGHAEWAPWRATKKKGLKHLYYKETVHPGQEKAQGYLISTCKYLIEESKEDRDRFFSAVTGKEAMGINWKTGNSS